MLRSADGTSSPCYGQTSSLLPPSVLPPISAQIQGPTSVGVCDGVTLRGSALLGDWGRALGYVWNVTEGAVNVSALNLLSASFAIPNSRMTPGSLYTVALTISNWLGQTNTAVHRVSARFILVSIYLSLCLSMYVSISLPIRFRVFVFLLSPSFPSRLIYAAPSPRMWCMCMWYVCACGVCVCMWCVCACGVCACGMCVHVAYVCACCACV